MSPNFVLTVLFSVDCEKKKQQQQRQKETNKPKNSYLRSMRLKALVEFYRMYRQRDFDKGIFKRNLTIFLENKVNYEETDIMVMMVFSDLTSL